MSHRRDPGPAAAPVTMDLLVRSLVLMQVRLTKQVANLSRAAEVEGLEDSTLGISTDAGLKGVDGDRVVFSMGVHVWAPQEAERFQAPLVIMAQREVTYSGLPEGAGDDVLGEFCRHSVPLAAWPYLRLDIHHLCLEGDVPLILLPLYKAPSLIPRDEVVKGQSALAWGAYRAPILEALEMLADLFDDRYVGSLYQQITEKPTEDSWCIAVDALHTQYRSLQARATGAVKEQDARALVEEIWSFSSLVQRMLEQRKDALAKVHAEVLVRWDEFAVAMERSMRAAWKSGALDTSTTPKLRRLRG